MNNFVPLSDMLKIDTEYLKISANKSLKRCKELKDKYGKNKDPDVQKNLKKYEYISKQKMDEAKKSEILSRNASEELKRLRKNALKKLSI